jgi:nucleotide-binding universal stress UspA family protein
VKKNRRKILLAVDGSDQAFGAVRYVSRLFPPNRMEVILFHVITKVPENLWDVEKEPAYRREVAYISAWELQRKNERQEFMERARQLFLDRNFAEDAVSIKIQERKVGIARDIVNESRNDYDGVVVGRWGKSLMKDFLWGSIADKLLGRLTHVPLCVVGGNPQIGKILVAIDASKGAMKGVDYVGAMADSTNWEVTLFHAARGLDGEKFHKAEKSMKSVFEEAHHYLEKAGFNRNQITTRLVTGVTSRAMAISLEALNGEYGTIVVGRRGLSNVEEFTMGRVSNKVIHMAREIAVWVVA